MKTFKFCILPFLVALLFTTPVKAEDSTLSKSINAVIDKYIALKNTLAMGDGNAAENKAKDLLAAISQVNEKNMNAKQAAVWNTYLGKLQYGSRHILEVNLVPHQREHFASLSTNLITVVKELKLNKTTLYQEYCTASKRSYLSETTEGRDPYMGMIHCSKVTETLQAVK